MFSKNAVVFAGWFPKIERANLYIDVLKNTFKNEDVYFGINPSTTEYHKTLNLIGYENVAITKPEQVVTSDASAFQTALSIMKPVNHTYDTVYFIHTKGISYAADSAWWSSYESYYLGFLKYVNKIEEVLKNDKTVGGVSYVGRAEPMNNSGYSTALDKYMKFPTTNVENIMSLVTVYAIRGSIVKEFIQNVSQDFYTDKLDRYFFETSFPLIVDRMGFKRHHLVMW